MDNVVRVQVVQAAKRLPHHPFQSVLSVVLFSASHGLDQRSHCVVHQLDKDPQDSARIVIRILHVQAEAVRTRTHPHQRNLVEH